MDSVDDHLTTIEGKSTAVDDHPTAIDDHLATIEDNVTAIDDNVTVIDDHSKGALQQHGPLDATRGRASKPDDVVDGAVHRPRFGATDSVDRDPRF